MKVVELNLYESSELYRGSDVVKYTKDKYDKKNENEDNNDTLDLEENNNSSSTNIWKDIGKIFVFFLIFNIFIIPIIICYASGDTLLAFPAIIIYEIIKCKLIKTKNDKFDNVFLFILAIIVFLFLG